MQSSNRKAMQEFPSELNALLAAIKYIAGECHKYPNDSVKDIVNDAFQDNDLPYYAEWDENDNTENPIIILSR